MGFLQSLKNMAQNAEEQRAARSVTLEGDVERMAYVYDPAPLKGTRKGSTFYADVVSRRVKLHSDATGTDWDSKDGGVALSVNGRVFGMTNVLEKTLKEMACSGYFVKVKVKRMGMYCEGIPEVVLQIPEPDEVFSWWDACRGLGRLVPFDERHSEECEQASKAENNRHRLSEACGIDLPAGADGDVLFVEDEKWPGKKPLFRVIPVDVSTELLPVKEGSSAKPHIALYVSGDKFAELTARNRQYAAISAHVGEKPYLSTCRKYERGDGTFCWKVAIVYLDKDQKK